MPSFSTPIPTWLFRATLASKNRASFQESLFRLSWSSFFADHLEGRRTLQPSTSLWGWSGDEADRDLFSGELERRSVSGSQWIGSDFEQRNGASDFHLSGVRISTWPGLFEPHSRLQNAGKLDTKAVRHDGSLVHVADASSLSWPLLMSGRCAFAPHRQ